MTMFDLLYETAASDTDLLQRNDVLGDIFSIVREVDFDFLSPTREQAQDFVEFVNGKSYGRAEVQEMQDGKFRVLVFIHMPITQHVILSVSGFMLCLSRLFRIDYKGWGSLVQKSEPAKDN
ncbi:ribonuclease E inhibitor RraB [Terracidiphilus gabretensis]|jgi:hypothetical protein|uniref:ribonuclease E inhibitor RraB n=1 Tax=Terracidiphilus gabretensis TaxID=1577687 RepID=UPI0009E6A09E|nr:ribonuclease E inhibitor RraB [Terracidiphilus gabretensis]